MRHAASEINRTTSALTADAIGVGAGSSGIAPEADATSWRSSFVGAMVVVVAPLTSLCDAEIIAIGRRIDFVPRDPRHRNIALPDAPGLLPGSTDSNSSRAWGCWRCWMMKAPERGVEIARFGLACG
jgi:hypothetical protein